MEKNIKMNTMLAKAEHTGAVYKKELGDYLQIFKSKQGMFRGQKNTFTPKDGFPDDPSKQGTTMVQTTVDEQFDWFIKKIGKQYLDEQFTIEATNSMGANAVELNVDGISFGKLTALELMRLKSLLTESSFDDMLKNIPVRSDSEVWDKSKSSDYAGREVYETPMLSGVTRTTETEEVILRDPNIDPEHLPSNYCARVTTKKRTIETGDYTTQKFSGEWTQTQKAELLSRKSRLLNAVIVALKEVNELDCKQTNLDSEALLTYIFKGK